MKRVINLAVCAVVAFTACKKEEGCMNPKASNYNEDAEKDDGSCLYDTVAIYTIPATYSFNDVSYSGQTARLKILNLLSNSVNAASPTNKVNYADLEAIYKNTSASLFGSSKDLYSKTYATDQQYFLDLLTSIDTSSNNGSGFMEGSYYVNSDGIEIDQLVQKGLMGAVLYYQATSKYLENISVDDNTNPGGTEATDMEHHFDEAFGYFGAPINFNENTVTGDANFETNANFWGKYTISRNSKLNNLDILFDAFKAGRAAISNQDYTARDAAIVTIRTEWEKVVASSVVHYINEIKSDLSQGLIDKKYHHWAEGKGFSMCLRYNVAKLISSSDLTVLESSFGSLPGDVTSPSDFDNALVIIKNTYEFTDAQMADF